MRYDILDGPSLDNLKDGLFHESEKMPLVEFHICPSIPEPLASRTIACFLQSIERVSGKVNVWKFTGAEDLAGRKIILTGEYDSSTKTGFVED